MEVKTEYATSTYYFKFRYSGANDQEMGQSVDTCRYNTWDCGWFLMFFPNKTAADADDHVTLCLKILTHGKTMTVYYDLGVFNKFGSLTSTWLRKSGVFDNTRMLSDSWVMRRAEFEKNHIIEGEFTVHCAITIADQSAILDRAASGILPVGLKEDLGLLLERGDCADLTFQVEGQIIAAHRVIVTARSPKLRVELSEREVKMNECVVIEDMEATIFRALLFYMYTDTISVKHFMGEGSSQNTSLNVFFEQLLKASVRYEIVGLHALCEQQLFRSISEENVLSTLILAEEHTFPQLKEHCLKFIVAGNLCIKVYFSPEYKTILTKFPSLFEELKERLGY
ncbi:hypothetical protein LUZ63_018353 [Rhynchospora breviuscula]|uniref:BTB domain-containing protein n=1 Tax=Rhynchospora breviuscula TaxID=2022672 RepID=A0A9Q0C466_9POAL|nr:hypothetical protein LUZ63_018353 [Rhynchospora breviuscula]